MPKSRAMLERGFSQGDMPVDEKGGGGDGSLSDTAVGSMTEKMGNKKGLGSGPTSAKIAALSGLTKKSSSTSQLSMTGRQYYYGFTFSTFTIV